MRHQFKIYQLAILLLMQIYSFAQNDTVVVEEEYSYEQSESNEGNIAEEFVEQPIKQPTYNYRPITKEESEQWQQPEDKTYNTQTIAEETIESYLNDKDFQYSKKKKRGVRPERNDWLSRFARALGEMIEKIFGFNISDNAFTVIKWILILGIVGSGLYFLLRYLGISINFKPKKKKKEIDISFAEIEENLEEVDFKELIQKAIQAKAYRVASRLYFLKNLQSLTKKNLIEWEIDKTNVDYKYELTNTKIKAQFDEIVYLYEHIWYGDFDLQEEEYQQAINVFQQFDKRLGYEK